MASARESGSVNGDRDLEEGRAVLLSTNYKEKINSVLQKFGRYSQSGHRQSDHYILNPLESFAEQWNRAFLLSAVIAVSLDPLFFYIIVVNEDRKCLLLDRNLGIAATVLRLVVDCFYLIYVTCRLYTEFFPAPSRGHVGGHAGQHDQKRKYLLSWFFLFDIIAVLPMPQVVLLGIIPTMKGSNFLYAMGILKFVLIFQYFPRILRVHPLLKREKITSGILAEAAWAKVTFNLFLYFLAGHVVGALWYFLAIERISTCWHEACRNHAGCVNGSFYCDNSLGNYTFLNDVCPISSPNAELFDFGIYLYALQSRVVKVTNFHQKFFHCFRWGIQNLSSLGQNLQTSTYIWENCFAVFIIISGLVLFLFLIGNVQIYLQSKTAKSEEMRLATKEIKQWKPFKKLSHKLQEEVNEYQRYRWQHTRGVDVEKQLQNLPWQLERNIKKELCLDLLSKVELFNSKGGKLLDALCFRMKPVLFIKQSHIIEEGDPINEMIFIVEGELQVCSSSSGNEIARRSGYYCGEELVEWVQDPNPTYLPVSSRCIIALTKVEAFALRARDMKRNWDVIRKQAATRVLSALRKRVQERKLVNSQSVNAKVVKKLSRSDSSASSASEYNNESSTSQPNASRFQARSSAFRGAESVIPEEQ